MRKWRTWEDANLPIYGSLLGRDLLQLMAEYDRGGGRGASLKELYCSLPYSENAIRLHLKRLIREGWVELKRKGPDRRFRSIMLAEKLRAALENYRGLRDGAGILA